MLVETRSGGEAVMRRAYHARCRGWVKLKVFGVWLGGLVQLGSGAWGDGWMEGQLGEQWLSRWLAPAAA